jgi:prevent-host-death family protein
MHTVSVADAKAHLSEILNEVIAGEEVIITRRGQPIARIEAIKKQLAPVPCMKKFRCKFPKIKVSSTQLIRQLREEGY